MPTKTYKTTKKHFELFQKEASRWIDFLGMFEWRIEFLHDPNNLANECFGWCQGDLDNMAATIALGQESYEPIEPEFVIATARHEVLELLLWPIYEISNRRYTTIENVHQARHNIIRRLESALDRLT